MSTSMKILCGSMIPFACALCGEKPQWTVFENLNMANVKLETISAIPKTLGGVKAKQVVFDEKNMYWISRKGNTLKEPSVFFLEFESKNDTPVTLGCGAEYFFEVRLNGQHIYDTLTYGNGGRNMLAADNFAIKLPVKKGKNLLCILVQSGSAEGSYCLAAGFMKDVVYGDFSDSIHKKIAKTGWRTITPDRQKLLDQIEISVKYMNKIDFMEFDGNPNLTEAEKEAFFAKYPILRYYDSVVDKLLKEVPAEKVPANGVVLWLVYNMGYIVKTEHDCFGIDIHHRQAKKLAPLLDFILTTHNHGDHLNKELLSEIARQGKSIYSNFYPCKGFSHGNSTIRVNDLTITMEETDHNKTLRGFMKTFQIKCGDSPESCVIYHTGDSCDEEQLHPYGKIDLYINHPRVGLKVPVFCERERPGLTLFSHMQEMGHAQPSPYCPIPFWRIQKDDMKKLDKMSLRSCIPLWGEKIVWTPAMRETK